MPPHDDTEGTRARVLGQSADGACAALSYYTLLSLRPLVLMAVAVAGLIFERATVEGKIVTEIRLLVGVEGSEVVQTVLRHASDPEKSAHSVVIGIAVLLLGATTVFVQLQSSLNRIWKVEESPQASMLWVLVKERLLSLAMVLAVGFLLLVSLLCQRRGGAFGETTLGGLSDAVVVLEGLNVLVSLVVVTLVFAMIFKVMPDAPVAWRDVWVGAVITAVLFTIGKSLIGLYLGRTSIGSPYGAAGSLVVMTVWVFYASMIVFFGAELTYFRSKRSRGEPSVRRLLRQGHRRFGVRQRTPVGQKQPMGTPEQLVLSPAVGCLPHNSAACVPVRAHRATPQRTGAASGCG
jgi:membrane protein